MGLVARVIEEAGVSTVVHSWIPELTTATGAPRTVGIGYPGSVPFGLPGDSEGQRAVLRASLGAGASMTEPGRSDLPFEWSADQPVPKAPKSPPITVLIKQRPWLYLKILAGDIPEWSKPVT